MRDARGRTAELVALDMGHVDCAGLFYNVDIHSYTPKRIESGGSSDNDESGAGERQEQGCDESSSSEDDDDDDDEANADGDDGDYTHQRDGETRASTSIRQGFDEAVAAARRASSLSVQQAEEGQADQRRPRASVSSFASGEGGTQEAGAEEGQREGVQGYCGGYVEWGENAQKSAEGYDGEGDANVEGERADWEWSETEGWVHGGGGGGGGGSAEAAGNQARSSALDEEQQDGTSAENFSDNEGYPAEGYHAEGYPAEGFHSEGYPDEGYPDGGYPAGGYQDPRESYTDWQQPYYPTAQGDSNGGSCDGTDQEDQQKQHHSGAGGDENFDDVDGVSNDNYPQQEDQQKANSPERVSWEWSGRGDPPELLQEAGVAAGGDDNRDKFEAALGKGWAPEDSEAQAADEEGRNDAAAPNHHRTSGNDSDGNGNDRGQEAETAATFDGTTEDGPERRVSSTLGWGGTVAVIKASNRWLSLLDRSSGNVYYQNERSGQTEWDVPEGAVVVSAEPEDT